MKWLTGLAAGLVLSAGAAPAAEKWDMPTAYADANYHTQNVRLFAKAVGVCTGSELEIVVHGNGSLFKGEEIKRAVQNGRAPIGERLLSAHQKESAMFGFDSVPFLASSFEASERLWQAAKGRLSEVLADQDLVLLYSVPWPPQGMYFKHEIAGIADMEGVRVPRQQRRERKTGGAGRHGGGARRGGAAEAGVGERCGAGVPLVRRDGLRPQGLGIYEPFL